MAAASRPKKRDEGRAGFLDATRSAAISETIKKEDRTLHRLLQKQIELGRIVLPPEADEGVSEGQLHGASGPAEEEAADPVAVGKHMAWLLAVHRGAGQALPCSAGAQGSSAEAAGHRRPAAQQQVGDAAAAQADEELSAAEMQDQMRSISRSLWGVVSAGMTTGTVRSSSRAKADYQYRQEEVEEMQQSGELTAEHHRRRNAYSAYCEAAARDAALRRGSLYKAGGSS